METGGKKKRNSRGRRRGRANGRVPDNTGERTMWPKPRSINFGPATGFPDRLECVLKWVGTFSFTAAPAPGVQTYYMNSLFDPDFTGGGTQPEFFVQLALIYKMYCVIGASAKIQVANLSSTESAYFVAAFCEFQSLGSLTTLQLGELKYAKDRTIGAVGGGHDIVTINMEYMPTSVINGQKEVEADDNLNALVTASPVDLWVMHCKASAVDTATNINLFVKVEIQFRSVFKELTNPP